eukprot:8022398-Pyramimonas_sp.AAC.1
MVRPGKKASRVGVWHGGSPVDLCLTCRGKHGVCSRAKKRRIELSGNAPGGRKWTSIATPYPPAFASTAAACVISAAENLKSHRLHSLYSGL